MKDVRCKIRHVLCTLFVRLRELESYPCLCSLINADGLPPQCEVAVDCGLSSVHVI